MGRFAAAADAAFGILLILLAVGTLTKLPLGAHDGSVAAAASLLLLALGAAGLWVAAREWRGGPDRLILRFAVTFFLGAILGPVLAFGHPERFDDYRTAVAPLAFFLAWGLAEPFGLAAGIPLSLGVRWIDRRLRRGGPDG